jgi:hypothetical protein
MLTIHDIELARNTRKSPRLKTLAKFINDNFPQYKATMEDWWGSFDRQIAGSRLRIPGKFIECKELVVYDRSTRKRIFRHNPREAYRYNYEVAAWILKQHKRNLE